MNLSELSIKRPIFITCVVLLMLILGLVTLKKMPVDLFPDVTFPAIFVQVTYPGASPVDVEKQIAKPIEDELGSLSGLKTITSNNLESSAVIVLQFKLGTDIKETEQQVRNRIANVRRKLPNEIKEPVIRRFDPADQAVITLAVLSTLDSAKIYDIVDEQIKPQIERIPDVGQLNIVGGRKQEIHILVDKNKLQDRKLSMLQVSQRIEETSKDVPVGKVENSKSEIVMRTIGEFSDLDQIKDISVNFLGSDKAVKIKEIAKVERALSDVKRISSIENQNAIFLDVYKQSGSNTVSVTDAVKESMEKVNDFLKSKKIDAKLILIRDSSIPIRLNIADVKESISFGIILCIIVVFFFLGSLRSTFITGMALPNSLLGGFIVMYAMGFSINIMTLLALSLAVGLLIDDAIVVRENIFRHLEMGKNPFRASLEGTAEVSQAVIATTLVVIAVFGPIAFVQGIIGQFFRQFGLTVVFTMLISLFDAFTVAPMLSSYLASSNEGHRGTGFLSRILNAFDKFQLKLEELYEKTIRLTLNYKKSVLFLAFLIFIFSLFLGKYIPKTFLPPNDVGEYAITVEKPVGTSIYLTEKFMKELEIKIREDKTISLISRTVGNNDGESNKGNFFIKLVPSSQRTKTTTQLKDIMRERLKPYTTQTIISVTDIDISGGGQKPLNLNLTGENLDVLTQFADKLKERFAKIKGLVDIETNFRSGKPEYHIKFDRERSESLGVSTVTAGAELRARTEGTEPAIFRENGIEYQVRLKFDDKYKDLRQQFQSTLVPNLNNNMIPLNRVAIGESSFGYSQINRQNKNRFIAITANLGANGSLGNISQEIEDILKNELKPPLGVEYSFVGQAEDFKDLMTNMILAMGLGILFIYLVLASLYESFITPITILLALPLAISGAMGGLFITGKTIDIFSLIGIVMLLGVVAKNSILLVDYSKKLLAEGMEVNQALIKACRTRLRPILMTSFALISGTLPIAIGLTELGAQRQSMGVSIIGGVLSSTFLTLIVVPAAFGFVEKLNVWVTTKFKNNFGGQLHD